MCNENKESDKSKTSTKKDKIVVRISSQPVLKDVAPKMQYFENPNKNPNEKLSGSRNKDKNTKLKNKKSRSEEAITVENA